ncbi:TonB-linked SusC/RagA family outer membrane protein [Anseongella ginsenosidimutans]|uniref:TonB-linked SusC/RagA family outer membrane protein n=1 Tax=Anseongella ginsenosidimutans TaxID=496056 RepID=A0A4R3KU81_9SPHI|nr:TonB-dependent receptor [Anseongella ginsenosidimutans]QEC51609.1 TonB-dependent receptor [Anseongella ginsenosidimutans]TCS88937.1 TonB-linked SusC/RagA family outer membrane protein [Anseongella ginsenosidimutans]
MRSLLAAVLPMLLFISAGLQAQDITVKGKVLSAHDELPLPGVSVQVKGSDVGTSTDIDGNFSLSAAPGSVLVFTSIGYLSSEIAADAQGTMTVKLQPNLEELESVVVVGYGTQKKENLTGAVTTLDLSTRENEPLTNVSNALHGLPGLFVNLGNSMPGVDRATIRIRGVGTLNNNNPLVLVDGIEYSMDELNPADIATVTVLKDASAAIYGSRAANGVILVTTKEGTQRAQVTYNNYFGLQQPTTLPDAIWDPAVYMDLKNQAVLNSGKSTPEYSEEQMQEYINGMATDPITYPSSNWFDIALDNGFIQKHDISASGGGDKYRYRVSLGYLDRDGVIIGPNNNERKYSLGLNTTASLGERLEIGLTLNGYYRDYTQPSYSNGDYWQALMRSLPIMPDQLEDGRYSFPWIRTTGRNNWEHPRMLALEGNDHKIVQRFLSTIYANYRLPFDIQYQVKLGVDKYDGFRERFIPQMAKFHPKTGARQNWNNPATAPRSYNYDDNDLNLHFYNTLSWQHQFAGSHNFSIMAGSDYHNFRQKTFDAQVTGYLDGSLPALGAGSERLSIGGYSTEDVLISYFGRLNYDYNEKYLLEATFRYDGSSRFAPGNRWGFFPSLSAAWRIDKEAFFSSSGFDLFKLRASIASLGNQAVDLYSYEPGVELGQNYNFGGKLAPGAATNSYTDPSIHWETTTTYNIGLDAALLDNRLSITADVYNKRTTDILRTVNLPNQVGNLTGPKQNVGTVDNRGIELVLQYRNNIGDFNYDVHGNVSYNKNKVIDLDGQILYGDGTNLPTITQEGDIMNAYYILDAIGIFQTPEEVEAHAFQDNNTRPGYIKYRDVNGDDIINGDDRIVVNASSIMPKYTFGFGLNLGYKGFALSADFQGIAGIKVYPVDNLAMPFNNGAGATWEWATDAWTPENRDARLPIVTESTGEEGNYRFSDFWVRDGSYLRLKSLQLSYALPSSWLDQMKIKRLSVFVNAQNWITFSKYDDFDPEAIVNAASLYHYPMLKTFSGGINVTF